MRKFIWILMLAMTSVLEASAALAPRTDSLWAAAGAAYAQGRTQEALDAYLQIEKAGLVSAPLYYNIGNCYYKLRYVAQSVLYYERALRLEPRNKDVAYNLGLARAQCIDKIEPVPEFFIITWTKKWMRSLTSDGWAVLALVLLAVSALLMLSFYYGRSTGWRKTAFILALLCILLTFTAGVFAAVEKHQAVQREYAIVYAPVSSVKSSPDTQGKDLLVVHEGTKVSVLEEVGNWSRVELADGRQGWIISGEIVYL